MILLLDYRNEGCRVGLIDVKKWRWFEGGERNGFSALSKAQRTLGSKLPALVAVTVHQKASWSTMRAAVAAANALAFAWDIPVREVPVTGDETDQQLAANARAAATRPQEGRWASPAYGGEPNISVAKSAL